MTRVDWWLLGAVAVAAILLVFVFVVPARAQNAVPCWYVPGGTTVTLACQNGFWQSTLEDGTVLTGNGTFDPNENVRGSGIPIDGNGSMNINRSAVTPPTQNIPVPAPYQGQMYGYPVPQ